MVQSWGLSRGAVGFEAFILLGITPLAGDKTVPEWP
jgi:hypothetical protein